MRVGLLAAWLGALLLPQVYLLGLRRRLPTLTHLWLLMPAAATAATSTSAAAGPPTQWTCCSGSMRREEQSLLCTSVTSHMPMGARRCAVLRQAAAPCCAAPGAPSRRCVSRAACSSALPNPRHLLTCRPPARASCLSPCLPCLPCRNCRSGMHSWNLWSPLQHTSPIWWGQATTVSWLDGWPLDWLAGWLVLAGRCGLGTACLHSDCLPCPAPPAEYDYERSRGRASNNGSSIDGNSSSSASDRAEQADASGEDGPYQPDWGNFGGWRFFRLPACLAACLAGLPPLSSAACTSLRAVNSPPAVPIRGCC